MAFSEGGANVVVRVSTTGVDQAVAQSQSLGVSWDTAALGIVGATRRVASGVSSLLSAQEGLFDAQMRVNTAQINYTLVVRQYGEGSIQAARALDQLKIAQQGVTVAQEKLDIRYLTFALQTGPAVFQALTKMMAASQGMTVANYEQAASWEAVAMTAGAALAVIGIGLLVFSKLTSGMGGAGKVQPTGIPGAQGGAVVNKPTLLMAGEAGPEALVPLTGPRAGAGLGGNVSVTQHISFAGDGGVDPRTLVDYINRQAVAKLKSVTRS
jgi:hypothetical protein